MKGAITDTICPGWPPSRSESRHYRRCWWHRIDYRPPLLAAGLRLHSSISIKRACANLPPSRPLVCDGRHHSAAAGRCSRQGDCRQMGQTDILVNSAGASGLPLGDGPVDVCPEDTWHRVLTTNLTAVYLTCKYFLPLITERREVSCISPR